MMNSQAKSMLALRSLFFFKSLMEQRPISGSELKEQDGGTQPTDFPILSQVFPAPLLLRLLN